MGSQGSILIIGNSERVSSYPTNALVFRAITGKWTLVANEWSGQVRVPNGLDQRNGNAMDWPTLRAFGTFWKPDDAQCCPTGAYIAKLWLDGSLLRIRPLRVR